MSKTTGSGLLGVLFCLGLIWQNASAQSRSSSAVSYLVRADQSLHDGAYERAIADYCLALQFDPRSVHAYTNRGLARQASGKLNEAIADYDKALEIEPLNANVYLNRGNARSLQQLPDQAFADYSAALAIDPGSVKVFYNRANLRFRRCPPEAGRPDRCRGGLQQRHQKQSRAC